MLNEANTDRKRLYRVRSPDGRSDRFDRFAAVSLFLMGNLTG